MERDSGKGTVQMALNKLDFVALAFMHLGVAGREVKLVEQSGLSDHCIQLAFLFFFLGAAAAASCGALCAALSSFVSFGKIN